MEIFLVCGVVLLTAVLLAEIALRTVSDTADLETSREWAEWGVFAALLILSIIATGVIMAFALAVQFGIY